MYILSTPSLPLISSSVRNWFILPHSRLLLVVYGQRTLSILCRPFSINTCTFMMMAVVVSALYSIVVLTFILKILTLKLLADSCFEFHIFFNCRNSVLALPILAITSASDPPCSSIMLSRYVIVSILSRASPLSVIELMFSVLYLTILRFTLYMLRPIDAETSGCLDLLLFVGME
uniref:G_PROTEIN_RECEP_F1_2 domain-containing protein n=1 Tax=Schistosoma curassoni TaxID=6186 RepID=A0A183L1X4_9TREM